LEYKYDSKIKKKKKKKNPRKKKKKKNPQKNPQKKKSNQANTMATDQDMKKALQQIEKVLTGLKAMYEYLTKDIQEIKAMQLAQNKRHEELAQVLEKFLQDPKFQATVDCPCENIGLQCYCSANWKQ